MDLFSLIIAIVVVGVVLYLINRFVPMEPRVKQILNYAVIIILIIFILNAVGFFAYIRGIRI